MIIKNFLLVMLLVLPLFGQVDHMNTIEIFPQGAYTSMWQTTEIDNRNSGGAWYVTFGHNNISGTQNVTYNLYIYRGDKVNSNSWELQTMATSTLATFDGELDLINQTYFSDKPTSKIKIEIVETGTQSNDIWINVFRYKG